MSLGNVLNIFGHSPSDHANNHCSDDEHETSVLPEVADIMKFLNQECTQIEEANLHSTFISKPASASMCYTYVPYNKYSKDKKYSFESNVSLNDL